MSDEEFDSVERQLSELQGAGAPAQLRATVLRAAHRQLKADRWDRRFGKLAAALLALGIGLNWTVNLTGQKATPQRSEIAAGTDSIVEVAVAVAEATDVVTGSRFAESLAAQRGSALSPEQSAAMEQEIQRRVRSIVGPKKEG